MRTILTIAVTLAATTGAARADAGAELAGRLGDELGIRMHTVMGLTGPVALESEALSDTRTLDPASAHPALDGYIFRARYIIVGPSGLVPVHSHADRPAITYVMNGEILEVRSNADDPILRSAGDITLDADIAQWWYNASAEPVFIFVGDLCPEGSDPACSLDPAEPATPPVLAALGEVSWPEELGTSTIDGFSGPGNLMDETVETLGALDLATALSEREDLGDLTDLSLRARRVTVEPGGIIPLHVQPERPNYFVVTKGNLTYYGADGTLTLGPSHTFEDFGDIPAWWRNNGAVAVELIAIDVVRN